MMPVLKHLVHLTMQAVFKMSLLMWYYQRMYFYSKLKFQDIFM